jgi:hypothetical protein
VFLLTRLHVTEVSLFTGLIFVELLICAKISALDFVNEIVIDHNITKNKRTKKQKARKIFLTRDLRSRPTAFIIKLYKYGGFSV